MHDDDNDDKDDNTDDDEHNNNGSNGNISSGCGDACDSGQYGIINNNDREHERDHDPDHDDDPDDDHDKDDDDEDDEDNKLNNRHHRQQQQQRGAAYRIDEVSPAKRNLLSPVLGGGAGVAPILDLFTDDAESDLFSTTLTKAVKKPLKDTKISLFDEEDEDDSLFGSVVKKVNDRKHTRKETFYGANCEENKLIR